MCPLTGLSCSLAISCCQRYTGISAVWQCCCCPPDRGSGPANGEMSGRGRKNAGNHTGNDMTDIFSPETRSRMMSGIHSKNTRPEIVVRKWLYAHGYRFRLHRKDLPGKPDIVLPRYHAVIFVHGCFWHRHEGCKYTTTPATRTEWWLNKFQHNIEHDRVVLEELQNLGWTVLIIWECQIKNNLYIEIIEEFLEKALL